MLQTNKRFSHLKRKQKEWISSWLRTKSISFMLQNQRKPARQEREMILNETMDEIARSDIWIPYNREVKQYYESKINDYIKSSMNFLVKEPAIANAKNPSEPVI